MSTLLAL